MQDNTPNTPISQDRRAIPGYEDRYEIDRDGNVYAMFAFKHLQSGRMNTTRINPDGYVTTVLTKNGKDATRYLHRLLMLTFCPAENSANLEVNHIDGVRSNNSLSNLEWVTHAENMKHSHRVLDSFSKNQVRGVNHGRAKLTESDVREIRRLAASGFKRKEIALQYGVSDTNITSIVKRKLWPHIE